MIKSSVVFGAGVAAGVYGVVKVRRIAEAFTPDGMRDRIGAAVLGARLFREEVAQAQADAETQLREHYRALESGARAERRPELEARTTMTAPMAALSTKEEEAKR
ncbi:MAG TPA: DUF6167 family protein [Nocardioides sp.]|nr:DUF6167 family protein [Nocardioides sp.]